MRNYSVWPVFRAGCHSIWEKRNEVKLCSDWEKQCSYTPYQSFEGSRTSDNDAFLATYDASVTGFNGQDILVADTDLKENECREIVIRYQFDSLDGDCQLIYISPDLEEQVLSESASGSVAVQLQAGANYIGITGTDYSGAIQITVG